MVTPNAQHIVLLESDGGLRATYAKADLVIADGASLVLASRLLGEKLRLRVAGVDLFEQLCGQAAELRLRVFLLGGRPGSAELAAARLQRQFPNLIVAGSCCPPMGFENDGHELHAVDEVIRAAQPDLVFVALGAPKQERWMESHGRRSGAAVLIGVGGSLRLQAASCGARRACCSASAASGYTGCCSNLAGCGSAISSATANFSGSSCQAWLARQAAKSTAAHSHRRPPALAPAVVKDKSYGNPILAPAHTGEPDDRKRAGYWRLADQPDLSLADLWRLLRRRKHRRWPRLPPACCWPWQSRC